MTPAQLATLKAAIVADAALATARTTGAHGTIADYYNAAAAPAVLLWRPSIPVAEMVAAVDWAAFSALTALKQNTYMAMTQGGTVDATSATVRGGFAAVFGGGSATVTALTALAQRPATRFEALFASGGVSSAFGQILTVADVVLTLKGS